MRKYISDIVDMEKIEPGQFNLITGGCGSGKTTFVLEDLLRHFPDVRPEQMIVVTSRSITVSQMECEHEGVRHYDNGENDIIAQWADSERKVEDPGVRVMTYDKIVGILRDKNHWHTPAFANVSVLVFDECHTLFVDYFIDGIREVASWVREAIFRRDDLIVIGITATPAALELVNSEKNKLPIEYVMPETLITYKAKNVIVTNFTCAIDLLKDRTLPGRNIMMCKRIEECKVVYELVPDSCCAISQQHKVNDGSNSKHVFGRRNNLFMDYEPYMDHIRNYIGRHGVLPAQVYTNDGKRTVNTLVTTSTFREGFNLFESSGVKNVFVVASDEMQITQFLGRCRYNVENLVVVVPPREFKSNTCCGYFEKQANLLEDFVRQQDVTWFNSIATLTDVGVDDVQFYGNVLRVYNDVEGYRFLKRAICANKMLSDIRGLLSTRDVPIYIWKGHYDDEIIVAAINSSLLQGMQINGAHATLNKVMTILQSCGVHIEVFPKLPDGTRRKCYCIYAD